VRIGNDYEDHDYDNKGYDDDDDHEDHDDDNKGYDDDDDDDDDDIGYISSNIYLFYTYIVTFKAIKANHYKEYH